VTWNPIMVDIASIVPSRRDFLQAVASRRKRLVLIPLVDRVDDAEALIHQGVTVFAVSAPGDAMRAVSAAVGSNPLLSLAEVARAEDALEARASGADAVVVASRRDAAEWEAIAKHVRSTRMAPLATATDVASAKWVAATAAKGVCLNADDAAAIAAIAAPVASLRVIARVPSADETILRALRGVVDAAIVESDLYLSTSFATLHEELDP
jgi:hypothetical protein